LAALGDDGLIHGRVLSCGFIMSMSGGRIENQDLRFLIFDLRFLIGD
jgi:hypothetical protein